MIGDDAITGGLTEHEAAGYSFPHLVPDDGTVNAPMMAAFIESYIYENIVPYYKFHALPNDEAAAIWDEAGNTVFCFLHLQIETNYTRPSIKFPRDPWLQRVIAMVMNDIDRARLQRNIEFGSISDLELIDRGVKGDTIPLSILTGN